MNGPPADRGSCLSPCLNGVEQLGQRLRCPGTVALVHQFGGIERIPVWQHPACPHRYLHM
jgi:hypothetical protein